MEKTSTWPPDNSQRPERSYTTLARLTVFLSWIGIHRFYVGKHLTGSIFIVLFFIQVTCKQMAAEGEGSLKTIALCAQIISLMWSYYDLFMVSFGRFRDEFDQPLTLQVDTAVPSKVQYGPLLLWACLFGVFGAHHFYAKNYKKGLLQAFTLGGFFVWTLWDIFEITKGTFVDAQGHVIAHIYRKDPHIDVS